MCQSIQQSLIAFLYQIQHMNTAVGTALGDGNHHSKACLNQISLRDFGLRPIGLHLLRELKLSITAKSRDVAGFPNVYL